MPEIKVVKPNPMAKFAAEILIKNNKPVTAEELTVAINLLKKTKYKVSSLKTTLNDCSQSHMNKKMASDGIVYPIIFDRLRRAGPNGANLWFVRETPIDGFFDKNGTSISTATTANRLVEIRLKQTEFRAASLNLWNQQCCATKITEVELLVAGHIKPWSACSEQERVDPYNSLLFSPCYDQLFDKFLITFRFNPKTSLGLIAVSKRLSEETLKTLNINRSLKIEFNSRAWPYLKYHNDRFDLDANPSYG